MQISQLWHYLRYSTLGLKRKSPNQFRKGMLITSIDLDVGSRKIGEINCGKNDLNVNDRISEYQIGVIEETAIPMFMRLFDQFQMPVTIAVRGQLFELGAPALAPLLESTVKHDIGVHGYSHKSFPDMTYEEAENELKSTASLMKSFRLVPKSFVYPRNKVAHLALLSKHGYECYRDRGDLRHDGMYIRKQGQIYDIHPSLYVNQWSSKTFMKKNLDVCINEKLPLHMWFHFWRFGQKAEEIEKSIQNIFLPFLQYAKRKVDAQELTFETMLSSIYNTGQ
jgi:hypothetical protein